MSNRITEVDFGHLVEENIPLGPLTTLGIGGAARYYTRVPGEQYLKAGIRWAGEQNLPVFVLGGGSNVVISDRGFPGLVMKIRIRGMICSERGDHAFVTAGAGEDWDWLVSMCVKRGWAGVECLSGIPGCVGAAPIQNIGAYGQEASETVCAVKALDTRTGRMVEMTARECNFGYRRSLFKSEDPGRFIIVNVTFRFRRNGKPAIRYAELGNYLRDAGIMEPGLDDVRQAVLDIRRDKSMLVDPEDADSRSAGSFFVNPVVTSEVYESVKNKASLFLTGGETVPAFETRDGFVKLSAAWLIEHSGFVRGLVHGGVGLSTKHVLSIINRGRGMAREVVELRDAIVTRVKEEFGITLTPEPVFVGFDEA